MDTKDREQQVLSRLKQEREKQKLSQLELAYKADISQNMIEFPLITWYIIMPTVSMNPGSFIQQTEWKEVQTELKTLSTTQRIDRWKKDRKPSNATSNAKAT